MLKLNRIHHVAVICSDYSVSKAFYTEVLGLEIVAENFRAERNSYKLDLAVNGIYQIELFSFPEPALRPGYPEARGLRHLAFEVDNIDDAIVHLKEHYIQTEEPRVDEFTNRRFAFFSDPDGLPIEFYEAK